MNTFFYDNQELLLDLANTEAGKFLIGRLGQKVENKIVKITQNSFHELVGWQKKKPVLKATFFSRRPIADIFEPIVEKMQIASESKYVDRILEDKYSAFLHYAGLQQSKKLPNIFLSTSTFNSAAGANSPVDGDIFSTTTGEAFSTIHSDTTGRSAQVTETGQNSPQIGTNTTSNQWTDFRRNVNMFDTSTLTALATITSASFNNYISGKADAFSASIALVSANPASTNNLVTTDYNITNFGATRYATDVTIASITTGQYLDMALNAAGLAFISKTGLTKFGLLIAADLDNAAPAWASNSYSEVAVVFADNGTNIPALVVTYTLPSGGFFLAAQ
jgi:hypothetical protein